MPDLKDLVGPTPVALISVPVAFDALMAEPPEVQSAALEQLRDAFIAAHGRHHGVTMSVQLKGQWLAARARAGEFDRDVYGGGPTSRARATRNEQRAAAAAAGGE